MSLLYVYEFTKPSSPPLILASYVAKDTWDDWGQKRIYASFTTFYQYERVCQIDFISFPGVMTRGKIRLDLKDERTGIHYAYEHLYEEVLDFYIQEWLKKPISFQQLQIDRSTIQMIEEELAPFLVENNDDLTEEEIYQSLMQYYGLMEEEEEEEKKEESIEIVVNS